MNFSDEQKFIGFVWNGIQKTVRLPVTSFEMLPEFPLQMVDDLATHEIRAAYSGGCVVGFGVLERYTHSESEF